MRFEVIRWTDSGMARDVGWASRDAYLQDLGLNQMTVLTAGLLMHQDDDVIVLAQNYDPAHDAYLGIQVIARTSILSRRDLGADYDPLRLDNLDATTQYTVTDGPE